MNEYEKSNLVLNQYRCYNEAKERFIDRNFTTNRFYMVLSLCLLLGTWIIVTLALPYPMILTVCTVGMVITAMWWLNIDTYQFLIKVKYSKIIDFMEEMLPIQPHKKEFQEISQMKKDKKAVVFADMQKLFTLFVFCIFTSIFAYNSFTWVRELSYSRF